MFFAEKVFRGPRRSVGRLSTLDFAICAFSFRPAAPLLTSGSVGPALRTLALLTCIGAASPAATRIKRKHAARRARPLRWIVSAGCSHTVVVTHHAMQCTLPKAPHFTFSPSHPLISHQSSVISHHHPFTLSHSPTPTDLLARCARSLPRSATPARPHLPDPHTS